MLRRLLLVSALLFLAACTRAPLVTPQEVFPADRVENAADVRRAIVDTLERRGWSVGQESPGLVVASIVVRDRHQVWVDIPYKWVQLLDADIRRQLQLPAPAAAAE